MKLLVAHEELWQVIPNGSHDDECILDLPAKIVRRIRAAQREWHACLQIIEDAWSAERVKRGEPIC